MIRERVEDTPSHEALNAFEAVCKRRLKTSLEALNGKPVDYIRGKDGCSLRKDHSVTDDLPYVYRAGISFPQDLSGEVKPRGFSQELRSFIWHGRGSREFICQHERSRSSLFQKVTIEEIPKQIAPNISKILIMRKNEVDSEEVVLAQVFPRRGVFIQGLGDAVSFLFTPDGVQARLRHSGKLEELVPDQLKDHEWEGGFDVSDPLRILFRFETPDLAIAVGLGPLLPDYLERLLIRERKITQGGIEIVSKDPARENRTRLFPGQPKRVFYNLGFQIFFLLPFVNRFFANCLKV